MTRGLSGGLEAVVAAEIVRPAYLLELRLDSGDVNVWSGTGTLNWNSKNWDNAPRIRYFGERCHNQQWERRNVRVFPKLQHRKPNSGRDNVQPVVVG